MHKVQREVGVRTYLLMEAKDPLRWLFCCDNGYDPGPLSDLSRKILKKRYRTDLWIADMVELEKRIGEIPERQRELVVSNLSETHRKLKPLLEHMRAAQSTP